VFSDLNDQLGMLEKLESPTVPLLSVYLNMGIAFDERRTVGARLRNLLDPIVSVSGDLPRGARLSVRRSASRVLDMEHRVATSLGHGVAIFVGGEPDTEIFLKLPRRVWDTAWAGSRPYLRPLRAALDEFHRAATVVVEPRRSEVTVTYMGEVVDQAIIENDPIRKANYAGWAGLDEQRNRARADEQIQHTWREVGEQLFRFHQQYQLAVVFVGGREDAVAAFLHHLHPSLKPLVAETFTVDTHTLTPEILTQLTAEMEERFERRVEHELVEQVIAEAQAGGLAALGLEEVLNAASQAAIDLLLVDGDKRQPGWRCPYCGGFDLEGPQCSRCWKETESWDDIVEALSAAVVAQGGRVEHVMADHGIAGDTVAALLRFRPPLDPPVTS
jgi:peptide subunit release factor 1 (eRF1)